MEFYEIEGKVPLRGEYTVKGAKNAVLPIMAASLIRPGNYHIHGCPDITRRFVYDVYSEKSGS